MTDEGQIDGTTHYEKDANGDIVHKPDVVNTESADITGDTYVEGHLSSNKGSNSAGSWVNILDTEDDDIRGELNSSQQFSPDSSGKYKLGGVVWFRGHADQDLLQIRVYNVTDDSTVKALVGGMNASGTGDQGVPFGATYPLDSAKTYEIQATNTGSTFTLIGGFPRAAYATIVKEVVHP